MATVRDAAQTSAARAANSVSRLPYNAAHREPASQQSRQSPPVQCLAALERLRPLSKATSHSAVEAPGAVLHGPKPLHLVTLLKDVCFENALLSLSHGTRKEQNQIFKGKKNIF